MNSETGGDPQTHSPNPSGESGRRRGAQRQGRRARGERGARGQVRNPISKGGLADAPIDVRLNCEPTPIKEPRFTRDAATTLFDTSPQEN